MARKACVDKTIRQFVLRRIPLRPARLHDEVMGDLKAA
jgi:hypothetical protein